MATQAVTNWKKEWFDIEDATYLNTAAHTVMPRVSIRAVEESLEAKKFPHRVDDSLWFEAPVRIRTSLAKMIGAEPEEIAVTTGASTGAAAVAHGLQWKPGDEIITAQGEFPLHYSTWKPMEEREGVRLTVVTPRGQFITVDDLIDALTPRTRIVSVSLVRYDDGALLDAARLSAACHSQGTVLLLDVSQACGALPMSVKDLGADFMVCAGYKWLLSCYGTGFFWVKNEHLDTLRPGPFYWTGQNTDSFSELNFVDPKPSRNAKRWDAAEWATHYNFNLSAMAESVDFVLRAGPELVAEHNRRLIELMFRRLPDDRCAPASPLDAARRGPFGCFTARKPEKTVELYRKLRRENIIVSVREGKIRVSPHLFNCEQDMDRLVGVVCDWRD
ncbi:MAG TPA: aminotransferase class V-fold PLP-dependent enzyme [Terriglobales bacterium]|nr:aminotransferase class V-fold PLP-dependent enzyme [Terriglobales bacterium]